MNYKMIFKMLGRVSGIEAALMVIPMLVALGYGESIKGFAVGIGIAVAVCLIFAIATRRCNGKIFSKEGLTSVALCWVLISLVGAIPFTVDGAIPNYIDAVFETVSGFTTTGSSILTDVEALGKGMLFWRSFTHWIGGMGILVFMMAVVPMSKEYSMHIMRAEVPGPEAGKLTPKIQRSSLILYLIYVFLTVVEVIILVACKMPLFDALLHSFGTAGTGGFGIKNASVGAYANPAAEVVIAVFMFLFGINFNLYFYLLMRKIRTALFNEELWWYIGIVAFSTLSIAYNLRTVYPKAADCLRYSFFQVSSIISTTGYSTANFDLWPEYSKTLIAFLIFVGACAGSTAGGIKVSRLMILFKSSIAEFRHMLHPRSYNVIRVNGKNVSKETLHNVLVFFSLYIMIFAASCVVIGAVDGFDFVTTFTGVATCISNVGPGLSLVGPMGNFSIFSPVSKILLSICMLMGRLEIFPIVVLFYPITWKKSGQF